jgi:hypothetical protein
MGVEVASVLADPTIHEITFFYESSLVVVEVNLQTDGLKLFFYR